jgi:hypothetical protein
VWDVPAQVIDDSTSKQLIEDAAIPPTERTTEHHAHMDVGTDAPPTMEISPGDFRPSSPPRINSGNGTLSQPVPIIAQPTTDYVASGPDYRDYTGMAMLEHMEGLQRDDDGGGDRLSQSFNAGSGNEIAARTRPANWRNRLSFDTIRRPRPKRRRGGSTDDALLFLRGARKPDRNTRWGSVGRDEDGGNGDPVTKEVVVEVRAWRGPARLFANKGVLFSRSLQRLEKVDASTWQGRCLCFPESKCY